jgi:hypothetical protein
MNGYQLYRASSAIIGFGLYVTGFVFLMGFEIHDQWVLQSSYRSRFGGEWKQHYEEEQHISVAEGNGKIVVAIGGVVIVPVLLYLIYRQIVPKNQNGPKGSRRRQSPNQMEIPPKVDELRNEQLLNAERRPRRSSRGARYRRNAAIGIPGGFLLILAGVVLALFQCGIFADHSEEFMLGSLVFFLGYSTVIYGCWSWAMAKHLNDALVMIGLAPLLLLLIPYVRLVIFYAPELVAASMIMMPVIMVSTIAILPSRR